MLHQYVECYLDDLVVKSKRQQNHLKDLKVMFDRLQKYQLRMNSLKFAFSVTSGKFFDFVERSLGALLAQEEEKGKECFHSSSSSKGGIIKYVLSRPIISGRLAKWAVLLQKSDIVYIPQKLIKGQASEDFLCEEVVQGQALSLFLLRNICCFIALRLLNCARTMWLNIRPSMALEITVSFIEIYGDSKLIINQLSLQYDVKHEALKSYFAYARLLMERFDNVMLEHVPKTKNKRADALANLATTLMMPEDISLNMPLCQRWIMPPIFSECQEVNVTTSHLIDEEDWRQPIIKYLEHGMLPKDSRHKTEEESIKALKEAHVGIYGAHQSGPKLQFQLRKMGSYWLKMVQDSIDYAKKCEVCQYHANFIHQPPESLHPIVAFWAFEARGHDLVGPITHKSSAGHSYILATTDYFSKWAEAISLRETKKENIADFIRTHIIYQCSIPHRIVTDNERQLSNSMIDKLCKNFKFKQYKSSMYNTTANDLAEAFNKTLCTLLKKIVSKSKRD
ncbi:uncharacterized protein E5676_scaffold46G001430 [Cucumis melo var. makuwa]|uniref:Uncharacterized protein n=1 Tax=Cucumis melo var. makuwa TaxID=1194695 RepID=A0A5D3BU85_CUCMM|nr:uncharacterized protein E6C27_scaffold345G00480 [Cucumis melo var. makuwa]TYK03047.1 uncharacterized protein E5676_scaffold46G001430 [Cucumis melo var. makuwa]